MTDNFAIWKPEHDGHAPPNWREGMPWDCEPLNRDGAMYFTDEPSWHEGHEYKVPAEALNSPNDDATAGQKIIGALEEAIAMVRAASPETLQKHGITLAPEKDWATELWAETFEVFGKHHEAARVRNGALDEKTLAAIQLLRTRFEQMKGEG